MSGREQDGGATPGEYAISCFRNDGGEELHTLEALQAEMT